MSSDPGSSAGRARRELGLRLRQVRRAAGLTGRALAERIGCHPSSVSRIESGGQAAGPATVRDWCVACDAAERIPDLLALAGSLDSSYLEWDRQARAGMRRLGDLHSVETYRRTRLFRIHGPVLLPGIFQTEAYIRRMLAFWYPFLGAPDDAEATVAMRAERTAAALAPGKRIVVVLGEQAVRTRRGPAQEHLDQLTHLLSVMRRPYVSVGIVPADARRYAIAGIGFWILDGGTVALETPTAAIKVTQPREIARYATLFAHLQAEAVYGAEARALITDVMNGG
ncbi:hypothetical protein GCM10010123_10140 [Pilimelia anulata]|uniref:HTH cro/C1-type domain-containing protein n=1 Tax=Pilimelia anulata TaxID=53371 RepID=A0A8J3B0V1_9ACTN|nr:helix-turn-helix transcriptional regulator [Pilimelia anulata]GGJ82442.1 hypothetical protein GCM10010123_10140 [Pilimelia anulata]